MDGLSLDALIAELAPLLVGRHLERPRLVGARAVAFQLSGRGHLSLWLDFDRRSAGPYLLERDEARQLEALCHGEDPASRSRQALLLLRKHASGVRVQGLRRVKGERIVRLDAGAVALALRLAGAGSALTLAVAGEAVATLGDPRPVWPPPPDAAARDWPLLSRDAVERELAADSSGSPVGRLLARFPALGPVLARAVAQAPSRLGDLQRAASTAQPLLLLPENQDAGDAAYAGREAVSLVPVPLLASGQREVVVPSWREAWQRFLLLTRRGQAFAARRRAAEDTAARRLGKLERLRANLASDLDALADELALRREAEALLAYAGAWPAGAEQIAVPDPYDPERQLRLRLDPALSRAANAERRFVKARRVERSRRQIALRLREVEAELRDAREPLARVRAARTLEQLAPEPARDPGGAGGRTDTPRRYLTSGGLTLMVGRSASENHRLTFSVARPEDLWLHARDVPGAHVILRDNEGRASAADLREAAEVAAFFSEARASAAVDVHLTRRKHVRPARGGPGRVQLGHTETLRVAPRDPEGRLRRR